MKLSIEKRLEFLEFVNSGTSKSKACRIVGISRPSGDKWLQDFYDKGPPRLDSEPRVRNQSQRKARHTHHDQIVDLALIYPLKGAEWISKKLRENGIQASTGSVYITLKSVNLERKAERRRRLLNEFSQNPQNLSEDAIAGLEAVSPHFMYRSFTRQKPGELVFVFIENGYVSNSRKNIRFTIFLDSCGSMAFVDPNIISFAPRRYKSIYLSANPYDHAYIRPMIESKKIIYDYFGFRLKMICVSLKNNEDMHAHLLQNQLKKMKIDVGALHVSDFNKIPFISDFRKRFRNEFIRTKLKTIRHHRGNEETGGNIVNMTRSYLKVYNESNILSWPNMDKSPYQHVSDCTGKKIYLPSENEWLQKSK